MKTLYAKIDKENPDPAVLAEAARIIRQGGLVAFPTETVYGLGANGLDPAAVGRIFQAKGRPADNPLILHIAGRSELDALVVGVPVWLEPLLAKFWPGPLTVVLPRLAVVPDIVTARLDTVAVRLPSHGAARALIRASGVPIAAPSANLSGRPSPTTAEAVLADMDGRIDMVLDAGPCDVGLESTVLDCSSAVPTILRPGGVTQEMLAKCLPRVAAAGARAVNDAETPRAPGMKYRHYAPSAPLVLFECKRTDAPEKLAAAAIKALSQGKRVGAIVFQETARMLPDGVTAVSYGQRGRREQAAARLYEALLYFDRHPVDVIFAEGVPEEGIGRALMNRLYKAASSVGEG